METLCYAGFASWYELCKGVVKRSNVEELQEELPETEYEYNHDDDTEIEVSVENHVTRFPCGTRARKRPKQKVIYTKIVPLNQDREEHFCQKIMLFTH